MPSTRELMATPPPMSPELRADIRFMAQEKRDPESDVRQSQPMSTESQANEIHTIISDVFTEYGDSTTDRLVMACENTGVLATGNTVEFTADPIGIRRFYEEEAFVKHGFLRLRARVTSDLIVPNRNDGHLFATVVQTKTPLHWLFKSSVKKSVGRATFEEADRAKRCAALALDQGEVRTT